MPLDFPKRPNVPIVGQTSNVILWYPTALIQCKCDDVRAYVIVVTGMQNVAACGHCGKGYMIEGITPTGDISIKVLTRTPPGPVS